MMTPRARTMPMIVFMLSEKPLLSRIQQIPGFLRG
jgi:hypothetical protein